MKTLCIAAATALALTSPVMAQSAGDWTVGLGFGSVQPKSDNGTLSANGLKVDVGDNIRPTITVEYFIRDNLGVELLAATPFKHDVKLAGLGKVGTVKHLPPVLSLQYHFDAGNGFAPFVGVGVNFTGFFSEKTTGALAGSRLELDDSWGLAAHIGADYWINERSAIRADLRWIDIDSDVKLNGDKIGEVNIDPLVVGASYVMKF